MAYTYNAKEANSYGLIEEDEYEVTIEKAGVTTLSSGAEKIALQFRIRQDIVQDFNGRVLFEDIWKEKGTPYFNRKRLNQLLSTQKIEDGQTFETIYDLLDFLKGSHLIVKVTKVYDDYRQEDVNKIAYYKATDNPVRTLGEKDKKQDDPKPFEVTPDDLPF